MSEVIEFYYKKDGVFGEKIENHTFIIMDNVVYEYEEDYIEGPTCAFEEFLSIRRDVEWRAMKSK